MREIRFALMLVLFAGCGNAKPAKPAGMPGMPGMEGSSMGASEGASSTVDVSPAAIASLGIRTQPAAAGEMPIATRAPATISWDPLRVVRVSTQSGVQVRTLDAPRPGERVVQGQLIARLYQPDLRGAFSELLVAKGLGDPWLGSARSRLLALGAATGEIDAALGSGNIPETTALRAPRTGIVLERPAAEGTWVAPGAPIAILGDTDALVVEAEVTGALPPVGTAVTLRDPSTDQSWAAKVSAALPTASAAGTRLRLQPEAPLPVGLPLVAEWQTSVAGGVWVPRTALVDTGERRVVFVEEAPGHYAPRAVEVGVKAGEQIQITSGLAVGDPVVVAGTFLLDSETQIGAMGHSGHGH